MRTVETKSIDFWVQWCAPSPQKGGLSDGGTMGRWFKSKSSKAAWETQQDPKGSGGIRKGKRNGGGRN